MRALKNTAGTAAMQLNTSGQLLAPILSFSRDALADLLCGALVRVARITRDQADVVRALVNHRGWHSNRVWASQESLAQLTGTSIATVKRTFRALRDHGLRVVPPHELGDGPGPHQFKGERRSEYDTNCYDLSGLAELLPTELVRMFRDLLEGVLDKREEKQMALSIVEMPIDPNDPTTWGDPLAPTESGIASSDSAPKTTSSGALRSVSSSPKSSISTRDMSNVDRKASRPERGADERAEAPRKKEAAIEPRAARFSGSILTPIRNKTTHAREENKKQPDPVAVASLCGRGLAPRVARQIAADRGPDWVKALLAYADGQPESVGAGWYVNVWRNWQAGDGTWPGWVEDRIRREKRIDEEARVIHEAAVAASLTVVSKPAELPKAPEERSSMAETALQAVRAMMRLDKKAR